MRKRRTAVSKPEPKNIAKRSSKGRKFRDDTIGYSHGAEGMINFCNDFVYVPIYPVGSDVPEWTRLGALPDTPNPTTGKSYKYIWESQQEVLKEALAMKNRRFKYRLIVFCWQRGEGKCEKKGSKVLMYDGTVQKVEDIIVGDYLMGDDNTPRKVLSLVNGKEEMFEVVPRRGESMVVTADHKLTLKERYGFNGKKTRIIDISLNDFLAKSDKFKRRCKLFKPKIPFSFANEYKPPFDPYFLGLWTADGKKNFGSISVNNKDQEIFDYLTQLAKSLGCVLGKNNIQKNSVNLFLQYKRTGRRNPFTQYIAEIGVRNNKHIPHEWRTMSIEDRLQFLAGYIDGDGCKLKGNSPCFSVTSSLKSVIDGVEFIARSLGFSTNKKKRSRFDKRTDKIYTCYDMILGGNLERIPTKLKRKYIEKRKVANWNVTGIREIKSVGEQEYFGFMLDGNGRYVRGDFTVTHNSLLACLIQIWKFFMWDRQQIMLGANSRDQIKFVHFDIMRDIIRNSPALYNLVGKRNIQEKEIRIKNDAGHVISIIRSISSFSGIVSNITGYTFSEIFDMKNPKFFVQLDGSIRNIPNAMGIIDSTVSAKTHVLYRLYRGALEGKMKTVFFSYRHSKHGDLGDYWNPNMDSDQLNDYKAKFPFGEFERYFLNLWSAGLDQVFSTSMIEEMGYIGCDGLVLNHKDLAGLLEKKDHLLEVLSDTKGKGFQDGAEETSMKITQLLDRCTTIDSVYKLVNRYNNPKMATMEDLKNLTEVFDTDWAVMAAMDFGDPYAVRGLARTIMTVIAKGLPRSRSTPYLDIITGDVAPKYIYCVLHVARINDHSLDKVKEMLESAGDEFDGIDAICSERYGAWDVGKWCEERNIVFEPIFPTYDRQRDAFKEVLMAMREGRFKCPVVNIPGSKKEDITREEFEVFQHDSDKRWFGSTEKFEKYGIQDDYIFATGWCLYGGRNLGPDDFRIRKMASSFGLMYQNKELLGNYA